MTGRVDVEPSGGGQFDQAGDATRRTHLANERTYLAWWRTGITAFAAAIGIGRIVPSLIHKPRWPYAIVGVGYAVLGILAVMYGFRRQRQVRESISAGRFTHPSEAVLLALTAGALGLGCLLLAIVAGGV